MSAELRIGAIFPQTELGGDPGAVRAWTQSVTDLGYSHIAIFDHVVGADPLVYEGWDRPYDIDTTFHEVMVLLGFIAALTTLELVTSILILPQRQAVLAAKQAAEIDVLTGGRFRLGVGIGWNAVEYDALGQSFTNRGARFGEQIELMRRLWAEPSVSFDGRWEQVSGVGIRPMPVQRPIPVWIGASADPALARAGRLGDGWFPQAVPGPALEHAIEVVHGAAREAGRDPSTLGMESQIRLEQIGLDGAPAAVEQWREAGATHVAINTMGMGLTEADAHIDVLTRLAGDLGLR